MRLRCCGCVALVLLCAHGLHVVDDLRASSEKDQGEHEAAGKRMTSAETVVVDTLPKDHNLRDLADSLEDLEALSAAGEDPAENAADSSDSGKSESSDGKSESGDERKDEDAASGKSDNGDKDKGESGGKGADSSAPTDKGAAGGKEMSSGTKAIAEQQKQTMIIVKRTSAAKMVFEKAKKAAELKRLEARSTKTDAEKAFCDAEAQLRKAVSLHKKAKVKQHAAIKKVAETINMAKEVMTAFEKAQGKANEKKSQAMKAARKAFDESLQAEKKKEAGGGDQEDSDSDDAADKKADKDKCDDALMGKAKAAMELAEEINETQSALIKKLQSVFKKAECPKGKAGDKGKGEGEDGGGDDEDGGDDKKDDKKDGGDKDKEGGDKATAGKAGK